jgi:membrane protein required for beta-lactamase induction
MDIAFEISMLMLSVLLVVSGLIGSKLIRQSKQYLQSRKTPRTAGTEQMAEKESILKSPPSRHESESIVDVFWGILRALTAIIYVGAGPYFIVFVAYIVGGTVGAIITIVVTYPFWLWVIDVAREAFDHDL